MFKRVVQFEATQVVPHRMGSSHGKRDPLAEEKVGSGKRQKASDRSDMVHYRETDEERKARIKAEKAAEKAMRRGVPPDAIAAEVRAAAQTPPAAGAAKPQAEGSNKRKANPEMQGKLGSFKEKLKSSTLPNDAAEAERKHKEDMKVEEAQALAKSSSRAASASAAASSVPPGRPAAAKSAPPAKPPGEPGAAPAAATAGGEPDKWLSFSDIWNEGEEESASDWLTGAGLKFHTTADKAFSMDSKRFKESLASRDPAENREAAADLAKKRSELRMADFRRGQKG